MKRIKNRASGIFDNSTPFLGFIESVLNVAIFVEGRGGGLKIIFVTREKKTRAILTITSLILLLLRINSLIRERKGDRDGGSERMLSGWLARVCGREQGHRTNEF